MKILGQHIRQDAHVAGHVSGMDSGIDFGGYQPNRAPLISRGTGHGSAGDKYGDGSLIGGWANGDGVGAPWVGSRNHGNEGDGAPADLN